MDDALDQHPFMEQALLEDAMLGEESSLDDSARAFSPLLVSEDHSNSEQSETRESQKSSPKNSKSTDQLDRPHHYWPPYHPFCFLLFYIKVWAVVSQDSSRVPFATPPNITVTYSVDSVSFLASRAPNS